MTLFDNIARWLLIIINPFVNNSTRNLLTNRPPAFYFVYILSKAVSAKPPRYNYTDQQNWLVKIILDFYKISGINIPII